MSIHRDIAIDLMKVVGVFCVLNSHLDVFYGDYKYLATGGTIGNALFFFCSGYTLFLNKQVITLHDFPNWYKRRFNRIYPSVFAIAVISCLLLGDGPNLLHLILFGGGWFVPCIMVYYIISYALVAAYGNKINIFLLSIFIVTITAFCIYMFFASSQAPYNMLNLKESNLGLLLFFACMLFGIFVAKSKPRKCSTVVNVILSVLFLILFYIIYYFSRHYSCLYFMQPFCMLPILGFLLYFYHLCSCNLMKKFYNKLCFNYIIMILVGMCLEMYLCQDSIISLAKSHLKNSLNQIFPFWIIIIAFSVFVIAFIAHCLSLFISQTFKDEDYNWRKIFVWYK